MGVWNGLGSAFDGCALDHPKNNVETRLKEKQANEALIVGVLASNLGDATKIALIKRILDY